MADDTSTTPVEAPTVSVEGEQPPPAPEAKAADVPPEVRKALREANKEAETLRRRLKEYEDRDKTEQQRLSERAEQAEREVQALRVAALRSQVALSKGLPADLVEFLTGEDEDSLSAQADRLLARLAPPGTGRPAGDVDQGARTTPLALNGDPLLDGLKQSLGIR